MKKGQIMTKNNHIYQTDGSLITELTLLDKIANEQQLLERIRQKQYSIKNTNASYRTINVWETNGLLDDNRENQGTGWRKFSYTDVIFIKLVAKLRALGLSISKIHSVKKALYENIPHNTAIVNRLEFAYFRVLALKEENTYLIINENGDLFIASPHDIYISKTCKSMPAVHIMINFNQFLSENINQKIPVHDDHGAALDSAEEETIQEIRKADRDTESISIGLKNGNIATLTTTKDTHDINPTNPEFGTTITQWQDGKVVAHKVSVKRKI